MTTPTTIDDDKNRITRFALSGGCAAKVGPGELRAILAGLPRSHDATVLVGVETGDDAGVVRLNDSEAIVCTADFITPPVDDPYLYGQIAAANALSDVWAMGGTPVAAIALCTFPKELHPDAAREILAGGQDKVAEAGAFVVGGHTVRGPELFYGLSVTGRVHPDRVIKNFGARPGDRLLLTKPLGSGLVINGLRKGALGLDDALPVLRELARLNRGAGRVVSSMLPAIHAATDVTGFGLVGHALGMARGSSGVALRISLSSLPLYPQVRRMVMAGVTTGSTGPNRVAAAEFIRGTLDPFWDALVHDPQTSGGLLIAVAPAQAETLYDALKSAGESHATHIGEVVASDLPGLELVA